jgi:hypothetical protein
MAKEIVIPLGGQERTIDVGKFWFSRFYGETTGDDPLNATDIILKPERQFDWVVAVVFAGLKTKYKIEKKPEDFTKDEVFEWVGDLEDDQVDFVVKEYIRLTMKKVEPGEAETQAENL